MNGSSWVTILSIKQVSLSRGSPHADTMGQSRMFSLCFFLAGHTRQRNNTQNRNTLNQNTTFISLPFIDDDLSRKINAKVRASGLPIKIAWQKGQTVSSILVRSALTPPNCLSGNKTCYTCKAGVQGKCTTKNVVYEIKCTICKDSDYVGESKRQIRLRLNEHLRDAKKQNEGHSVRRPHAGPPLRHHDHKHSIEH